ncbi:hypothetical protein, partial [Virgisporangium aurantiacum]|uniref:hypothetical protein n=1 Tax=Virgisporangium aurantiacum TaxID=175570 RepID=UPI001951CBA0
PSWALPYYEILMASPADAALATRGITRHDAVRVEVSFTVLGRLVAVRRCWPCCTDGRQATSQRRDCAR